MSAGTSIEWATDSWNPVVGCTRVSSGCDRCYAVTMTRRLESMGSEKYAGLVGNGHFNGTVRLDRDALSLPLRWKEPRERIFVNSMSDLFHEELTDEEIAAVYGVMAATPQHTYLVLTKRPERAAKWFSWVDSALRSFPSDLLVQRHAYGLLPDSSLFPLHRVKGTIRSFPWPLQNVWLIASCEDQGTADERIPWLLRCPAAVRGVSLEPLLGPIDLASGAGVTFWDDPVAGIGWVIVGGESGYHARAMDLRWAESIVEQCAEAGVPCFVKQLGARPVRYDGSIGTIAKFNPPRSMDLQLRHPKGANILEWPTALRVREFPA